MTTLRKEIESQVITFGYHAGEQGAYKICANEILKVIEKRIGELIHEYEIRTYDLEDLGEDIEAKKNLIKYEVCKQIKNEVLVGE